MEMYERIKSIRKYFDMTQEKFADKIGLKQNTVALIESGKRNTSDQTIIAICREFGVSETWLRTGEGEMFAELSRSEQLAAFFNDVDIDDGFKSRFVSMLAGLSPEEWDALETVVLAMKAKLDLDSSAGSGDSAGSVADAEAAYEKSLGIAPPTGSSASNTITGEEAVNR